MTVKKLICGFLVLTYACNNRCKWCYISPTAFRTVKMDFRKIKDYLKLLKNSGARGVGLIGGEPTIYPGFLKVIKMARSFGLKVTLYTNGRKLSNLGLVKKIKNSGVNYVNFSLQGGSNHEKYHNKIVGVKNAWQETKKGIANCFKEKLNVNILTVLAHNNFKIYKGILDEFGAMNPLFIFFREVPPIIPNKKFFKNKVLSNTATKEIYKKIYNYAQEKKIRTYLFSRMPLCWWNPQDKQEKKIFKEVVCHCHIINGRNLIIDVDGQVLPCTHFVNLPSLNLIENKKVINRKEFLKRFNNGAPAEIRKNLIYYPHKYCQKCIYYGKRCTGGCPLVKFEVGPFAKLMPRKK